jgi:type IV pilus assembly protein PilA
MRREVEAVKGSASVIRSGLRDVGGGPLFWNLKQLRNSETDGRGMRQRPVKNGFSLIELLIVVAIILVIAAIAIPNLLRSKMAANQVSAVESLRMINTAEVAYTASYNIGFTSTLLELGPPATGSTATSAASFFIDSVLAGGMKSGYQFLYTPAALDPKGNYQAYQATASPTQAGMTGNQFYYTDQTHVIRGNMTGTASSADSSVAQ